jgi:hypothetical protein
MLAFQRRSSAVKWKMMMCGRRFVAHCCLLQVSLWVLAAWAWVILGAAGPGDVRNEVSAATMEARMVLHPLSECGEPAYRSRGSRRFCGSDLEMSESRLKGQLSIRFQRKSVA